MLAGEIERFPGDLSTRCHRSAAKALLAAAMARVLSADGLVVLWAAGSVGGGAVPIFDGPCGVALAASANGTKNAANRL